MRLIVNNIPGGHVSLDTVAEFEKTILTDLLVIFYALLKNSLLNPQLMGIDF